MNTKELLLIMTGLFITSQGVAQSTDSPNEKYVKKVLIEAKWGDEPGEFKLGPFDEVRGYKTSITLDKKGNVYLADCYKSKINIFTNTGVFMKEIDLARYNISSIGSMVVNPNDNKLYLRARNNGIKASVIVEIEIIKGIVNKEYIVPKGISATDFLNTMDGNIYLLSMHAPRRKQKEALGYVPLKAYIENGKERKERILEKQTMTSIDQIACGIWRNGMKLNSVTAEIDYKRRRVVYLNNADNTSYTINLLSPFWGKDDKETYITSYNDVTFDYSMNCYQVVGSDSGLKVVKFNP